MMNYEKIGTGALVAATVIVGGAIAIGDEPGKVLNGIGGITWFASTGLLVAAARQREKFSWQWVVSVGLTAAVAFVIKPSDLELAIVGFGGSGLIIGSIVKADPLLWAKLIPALYLPAHIGTAVLKAAGRSVLGMDASIRSSPPPTAAIVPFVMVAAAFAGGMIATAWRQRRTGARSRERQVA